MRKILFALSLAMMLSGVFALASTQSASAAYNPFGKVCQQKGAGSAAVCKDKSTSNPLTGKNGILVRATQIVSIIAGIAAVIILVVAGMKYMTASGDSSQISEAKRTIIYAVAGLAFIVLAQTLITFVLSKI